MMKLLHVEWLDAASTDGCWMDINDVPTRSLRTWTIGFVVNEDDDTITLAQSRNINDSIQATITIPKGMIVKRRILRMKF